MAPINRWLNGRRHAHNRTFIRVMPPWRQGIDSQKDNQLWVRGTGFRETRKSHIDDVASTSTTHGDSVLDPRQATSSGDSGLGTTSGFSFRSLKTALSTLTRRSNPREYATDELSPVKNNRNEQDSFFSQNATDDEDFYFDGEFDCRSGNNTYHAYWLLFLLLSS